MSGTDSEALELARKWLLYDKDPDTRAEMSTLMAADQADLLMARLSPRIAFGTAGLRARTEAGFARMNALTVIQTSNGLAEYLLTQQPARARDMGVVIGRDARHHSDAFARLAAAACISRGIKVYWLGDVVHTPLVPFSVKTFGAAAGIMITASHNPPQDNGYKVYWSNGCQIIPPHDAGIAEAIDKNLWGEHSWDIAAVDQASSSIVVQALPIALPKYMATLRTIAPLQPSADGPSFVYTPLHGVGQRYMAEALVCCTLPLDDSGVAGDAASPAAFVPVAEQSIPNPNFPTVQFPNPEEAGALDLAISTADARSMSLIIANDPDADRFCAAEKAPDGSWHQFTGNQTGMLLASYLISLPEHSSAAARTKLALLNTTVSTGMLRSMAEVEGFRYIETLTGFKWLGNVAQKLQQTDGLQIPYAFEEALGYMFTDVVHDKDGIAAAVVFLAAAQKWRREQKLTVRQQWERLCERYGYFVDANTYLKTPSPEVTGVVFGELRKSLADAGRSMPEKVGGRRVTWWRDLTLGFDSAKGDGKPDLPIDSGSHMISAELEGELDDGGHGPLKTRITVRGSGTEPKIKLYIESEAGTEEVARREAQSVQDDLVKEWFDPQRYGLKLAGT